MDKETRASCIDMFSPETVVKKVTKGIVAMQGICKDCHNKTCMRKRNNYRKECNIFVGEAQNGQS